MHLQKGVAMMAVVLTLTVLSTLAFMLSRQSAINASGVSREHERDQARYTAEAGLNHSLWLLKRANCQNYSDLVDITLGTQKYTVTVTPKNGSPVNLKATGSVSSGVLFSLTRNDVKVYQSPAQLVLQPDESTSKDSYLYKWRSSRNYGSAATLNVDNTWDKYWKNALLQFDLSQLSADALILSAELELYQSSLFTSAGDVTAHRITQNWVEGAEDGKNGIANWVQKDATNNWITPGGDFDPFVYASVAIKRFKKQWYSWDLTALTAAWVAGRFPNYGVLLQPSNSVLANFTSSNGSTSANHPILRITYTCECGKSCLI